MKILFYDTETSDFAGKPTAHLVQFAARFMNYDDFQNPFVIQEFCTLVQCPIECSKGAQAVHGISREMCLDGADPIAIVNWFRSKIIQSDLVVAHNIDYDHRMMRQEMFRGDVDWIEHNQFCTMKASTELCKIPPTNKMLRAGFNKFKSPKLEEALEILCNKKLENAHDALADTRGCEQVFRQLVILNDGSIPKTK